MSLGGLSTRHMMNVMIVNVEYGNWKLDGKDARFFETKQHRYRTIYKGEKKRCMLYFSSVVN